MTDQAPELLPEHPRPWKIQIIGVSCYIIDALNDTVNVVDANDPLWPFIVHSVNTRPPSERPVAQVREALDKLADKISAKVVQLQHYRDHGCQLDHARIIAEGRLQQAQQILHWVAESAVNFAPALTAERPEAGRENLTAEEFAQVLPHPEAAVVTEEMLQKACEVYSEVYADDDKDMGDAMRAALKAALAIQHEEPGRETMTMIERSEFEIVRKASRLFEDAANAWMERALKAEAALSPTQRDIGR